jgi:hypothetical protein
VRILEAKDFDANFQRFILPVSRAKGKREVRVIYLNEKALAIVACLPGNDPGVMRVS